jgi:hypothetical protein
VTQNGGHGGQNLLGLALMHVRAELVADVQAKLAALAPPPPVTPLTHQQKGRLDG